jgi:dTDP-4-amino-4,6-dideoxygalactose transaminase
MGDASFFSFGRDKIISSVFGGAAFIKDNDKFKKLDDFCQSLPFPSRLWTFQQLLHPILTNYIVIPVYGVSFFLGKILIGFFHKTLLLSKSVYKKEKKGMLADFFPKKMPSSLSSLFSKQIGKLERFNEHRRKIAEIYSKEISKEKYSLLFPEEFSKITPIFMRYPILAKFETDDILKKMRKNGIYLNDGWRKSPIVPPDTDLKSVSYTLGSCPNAEEISKKIINLPTHINVSEKKARKIIKLLNLC